MQPSRADERRGDGSASADPWAVQAEDGQRAVAPGLGARIVVFGVVCFAVILIVRLGSALLGQQILAGTDILPNLYPWSDGGLAIKPQNWQLGDSVDASLPGYLNLFSSLWAGDPTMWASFAGPGRRLLGIGGLPTFTPVTVWWMVMPPSYAIGFVKLTQLVAAFVGMALWLRRAGTSWAAGVVAGLLYIGSGFLTAWSNWPGQSATACLLPALFWTVERLIAKRTLLAALPVALVVGFLMLGGFPAVAGHALYAGGLYFLVRIVADRMRHSPLEDLKALGLGIGAVALGIGIAAIQVLPTLKNLESIDTTYRDTQFFTQQPFRSLLSVIFPQSMTNVGYPQSNPVEAYAYVGMGAIVLGLIAIVAGRRVVGARRGIITFLTIGSLLSASLVWHQGFWTRWMADLPIFADNNSGRLRDLVALFLCALAGFGFQALIRAEVLRRVRIRMLVAAVAGLAVLAVVTAVAWHRYRDDFKDPNAMFQDAVIGLTAVVLIIAVVLLLKRPRIRAALVGLLVVITTVSTLVSMNYFYPTVDEETFYPTTPLIAAAEQQVGDQRMMRANGFLGSSASAYNIRTVEGHMFYPKTWADLLNTLDPTAFVGVGKTITNPSLDLAPENGKLANPLLDRLSVNTVYASPGRPIPGNVYQLDGEPHTGEISLDQTVTVSPDQTYSVNVTAQPIRAIRIWIAQKGRGKGDFVISATVRDASGKKVASGGVNKLGFAAGPLDIPIGGLESTPTDHSAYTVTLGVKAADPGWTPKVKLISEEGTSPTARVVGTADDNLRLVYADTHGVLWERTTALPRIRWASHSIVETEMMPRLTHLVDPATPRDAVLLSAPGPKPSGKPASLDILEDVNAKVSVRVDAEGSGYLVVADGVQFGYSATIDGQPVDLVHADHAFGAVFVPEGSHVVTVEFTGEGMGVKTGLVITGASVVILVLLAVFGWWWQRRGRARRSIDDGVDSTADSSDPDNQSPPISGPAGALPRADRPPSSS